VTELDLHATVLSALMIDYVAPSLDTTISGIASALALFASHPDQWDTLRAEPSLLPNAIKRGAAIRIAVAGVHPKIGAAD
jgi:cytochrome P450